MATTPIFTADGRVVGQIEDDVYFTRRRRSIHQLRRPASWAIDRAILHDLSAAGVEFVEVYDLEERRRYTARLGDFWRHGVNIDRGHGAQIALPLAWWRVDGQRSQFEQQAEAEAARHAQLSLWELAR